MSISSSLLVLVLSLLKLSLIDSIHVIVTVFDNNSVRHPTSLRTYFNTNKTIYTYLCFSIIFIIQGPGLGVNTRPGVGAETEPEVEREIGIPTYTTVMTQDRLEHLFDTRTYIHILNGSYLDSCNFSYEIFVV